MRQISFKTTAVGYTFVIANLALLLVLTLKIARISDTDVLVLGTEESTRTLEQIALQSSARNADLESLIASLETNLQSAYQELEHANEKLARFEQYTNPDFDSIRNQLLAERDESETETDSDSVQHYQIISTNPSDPENVRHSLDLIERLAVVTANTDYRWALEDIGLSDAQIAPILSAISEFLYLEDVREAEAASGEQWVGASQLDEYQSVRDILADTLSDEEYSSLPEFEQENAARNVRDSLVRAMLTTSGPALSSYTAEFVAESVLSVIPHANLVDSAYDEILAHQVGALEQIRADVMAGLDDAEAYEFNLFLEWQQNALERASRSSGGAD